MEHINIESLNGIKLQSHDMKREGNEILYFKQLKKSSEGNSQNKSEILTEQLFSKFDYLLVTPDNELLGIKNEKSELLYQTNDAYKLAQGMFISG